MNLRWLRSWTGISIIGLLCAAAGLLLSTYDMREGVAAIDKGQPVQVMRFGVWPAVLSIVGLALVVTALVGRIVGFVLRRQKTGQNAE